MHILNPGAIIYIPVFNSQQSLYNRVSLKIPPSTAAPFFLDTIFFPFLCCVLVIAKNFRVYFNFLNFIGNNWVPRQVCGHLLNVVFIKYNTASKYSRINLDNLWYLRWKGQCRYIQPLLANTYMDSLWHFPFLLKLEIRRRRSIYGPQTGLFWICLNIFASEELRLKVCCKNLLQYLNMQPRFW